MKIRRKVLSTKDGYLVQETLSCGTENTTKIMNRAEVRTYILSFGVCEHIAESLISKSLPKDSKLVKNLLAE